MDHNATQPAPQGLKVEPGLLSVAITMNSGQPQASAASDTLTCFLVEDSPLIRQNLVATLEEMLAVQVVGMADDPASALAWLRDGGDCRLMIIDIFLKSGSGLDVLREARRLRPQAQLVVLTNYATPDIRRRCQQLGADRVFDKSAELDELLAYCEALAGER